LGHEPCYVFPIARAPVSVVLRDIIINISDSVNQKTHSNYNPHLDYLKTKIHTHELGIRWCKKMLEEYGDNS